MDDKEGSQWLPEPFRPLFPFVDFRTRASGNLSSLAAAHEGSPVALRATFPDELARVNGATISSSDRS